MKTKSLKNRFALPQDSKAYKWIMLSAIAIVFAATFSSSTFPDHFYAYNVNDIARENIKSPDDFLIDDVHATEERRREVARNALTVYDFNDKLTRQIKQRLTAAFETARKKLADQNGNTDVQEVDTLAAKKEQFENLLGISVSKGAYTILEKENFSKTIENLIYQIVAEILENGVVVDKEELLKEKDKGIILSHVGSEEKEIILNLKHFYSQDQAQAMVRIIGDPLLSNTDYTVKNLIVDFAQRLIKPNVTLNASKTEKIKNEALESVKPIFFKIKKGEMILREGQRVTEQDLIKLERLESEATSRVSASIGIGAALLGALVVLVVFLRNSESKRRGALTDSKNLLFFTTMLCLSFVAARLSLTIAKAIAANSSSSAITPESIFLVIPLASSAMIVCLFMDIELTASFALILVYAPAPYSKTGSKSSFFPSST